MSSKSAASGATTTHALLSNGAFSSLITAAGTGFSSCAGLSLNRWRGDPLDDTDGVLIYVTDLESGIIRSAAHRPVPDDPAACRFRAEAGCVALERRDPGLETRLEICVPPDGTHEVRRLTVANRSDRRRRFEITSLIEVVLQDGAAHEAHPGFSRLFLQTAAAAGGRLLTARRRPRGAGETFPAAFHAIAGGTDVRFETDRSEFLGRGGSVEAPRGLHGDRPAQGRLGNVLDPVLSLGALLALEPGASGEIVFLFGTAPDEAAAEEVFTRFRETGADAAFTAARAAASGPRPAPDAAMARAIERLDAAIGSGAWSAPAAPVPRPDAVATDLPPRLGLPASNGFGRFTPNGRAYEIRIAYESGRHCLPPLPWVNVLANESFGCLVSETGAGAVWNVNSREHRLTPWSNDPVLDPCGDVLFLRDEASGRWWSPLPAPAPAAADYTMRHTFGSSFCRVAADGLVVATTIGVSPEDPVRITRVGLMNLTDRSRRIRLCSAHRLVLGPGPLAAPGSVTTDADDGLLYAVNPTDPYGGDRTAFAAVSGRRDDFTTELRTFTGPGGSLARPAAVAHGIRMDGFAGTPAIPGFALSTEIELPAGEHREIVFLFGEAESREAARAIVDRLTREGEARREIDTAERRWLDLFDRITITTPRPELDRMVNGWLPYQTLACRMMARTAFYQSGGAYGFRDQLQDAASFLPFAPEITRAQILRNAAHQFVEGDVLHWWHPPHAKGIRTRFADDLLWLPLFTAEYVDATGDTALLDETVRYVEGPALAEGEDEIFITPSDSGTAGSVYEHCCRAIDRSLATGAHGLPLFGTGDWNDGMNRVGRLGRGESVWMGFFLYRVLETFEPLAEGRGDRARAERYAAHRARLRAALDDAGWDGGWYRRGYYDDGAPLGTAGDTECRIDALAQAWSVLSGAGRPERAAIAMEAVEKHLVSERDGLIRLLTPPFVDTPHDPGYIKGYVAGVRENGGQYTHAALWVVKALAELGRNDRAERLLAMLNPAHHTRTAEDVAVYQVEPYVIAADVYGAEPHVGRGGWTWYTGSSGWMHRVAVESILGLRMKNGTEIELRPCVPDDWPEFTIAFRPPGSDALYTIRAANPRKNGRGVAEATLDGAPLTVERGAVRIPIVKDGEHAVEVVLGGGAGDRAPAPRGGRGA